MEKDKIGKDNEDKEDPNSIEKQNSFCSQKENKKNNRIEIESQIIKLTNNSGKNNDDKEHPTSIEKQDKCCTRKDNRGEIASQIIKLGNNSDNSNIFIFNSNSYSLLNGKLNISMSGPEKRDLANKYWIIKPENKYEFYGVQIKTIWHKNEISKITNLIGIFMVFKNFLTEKEYKRFDEYFKIIIKCSERGYTKGSHYGKLLYIGGDLKCKLGIMINKEFSNSNKKNNSLPLYLCIMTYNEYEKIELDALDLCDRIPIHDGFGKYYKVFHQNFPKALSNKVTRITNEKRKKREMMKNEENKNNS